MAANRVGRRYHNKVHSPNRGIGEQGLGLQRRQARVTVKYNRKELQKRLDVEKWIDDSLDELYSGRESEMPEVNIDGLLDLLSDQERGQKLQDILHLCNNNTEPFIKELVLKLSGLQKQEELHKKEPSPTTRAEFLKSYGRERSTVAARPHTPHTPVHTQPLLQGGANLSF